MNNKSDFSEGKMWQRILSQAFPLMMAQLVLLLYNIVDRIYIGHLPVDGSTALAGLGLVFPLATLISAFTQLFGNGGVPLFSISRGAGEKERAEKILGQSVFLLLASAAALTVCCYVFRRPVLYLFGAGDLTYRYADEYLRIYLLGTPFVMLSAGLNGYINAQGYPRIGMGTTVLGAILNLILDPVFIFGMNMGVRGAAIATVISQAAAAVWVIRFFMGPRTLFRIRAVSMKPDMKLIKEISSLGLSGFIMAATNCLAQVVCNSTLKIWGGDVYVGVMTIINSVREVLTLPVMGISSGAQPVLGFNYGAGKYKRVRSGIRFTVVLGTSYTVLAWLAVVCFPRSIASFFTTDPELLDAAVTGLTEYFLGFAFMALQFVGQACFVALRCPKRAVFFSLLRKAVIVAPLTIVLPTLGMGVHGVFYAEPISNLIGGTACFATMWFTLYRHIPKEDMEDAAKAPASN